MIADVGRLLIEIREARRASPGTLGLVAPLVAILTAAAVALPATLRRDPCVDEPAWENAAWLPRDLTGRARVTPELRRCSLPSCCVPSGK